MQEILDARSTVATIPHEKQLCAGRYATCQHSNVDFNRVFTEGGFWMGVQKQSTYHMNNNNNWPLFSLLVYKYSDGSACLFLSGPHSTGGSRQLTVPLFSSHEHLFHGSATDDTSGGPTPLTTSYATATEVKVVASSGK